MNDNLSSAAVGARDVVAAWLLCLAVAALAFASPTVAVAPSGLAGIARAALSAVQQSPAAMLCAGTAFVETAPAAT